MSDVEQTHDKVQQESTDDKKLIEKKKDIIISKAQNCLTLQT